MSSGESKQAVLNMKKKQQKRREKMGNRPESGKFWIYSPSVHCMQQRKEWLVDDPYRAKAATLGVIAEGYRLLSVTMARPIFRIFVPCGF